MKPVEFWLDVKSIAEYALRQPEAERDSWVRIQCGDDAEKLAAVRRFLTLSSADEVETTTGGGTPGGGREGTRLGPYKLNGLIGRGGYGEVYSASRVDNVRMRVAIKLLRPEAAAPDVVRRFRMEAQILAALDHPAIVRLLDAGESVEGQPYFVMEYVEGVPLTKYCGAERLSLQRRLELFRSVCQAVQHAHNHFFIHRDLKPNNILVTNEGQVKVLDFGISRLLEPELYAGVEVDFTEDAPYRALTPAYASPEQFAGAAAYTPSDVYALGVVLHELLTGALPFDPDAFSSPEGFADAVRFQKPLTPSLRIDEASVERMKGSTAKSLRREMARDLDFIVMKAIEKAPGERYQTAELLAGDIDRYLRAFPVEARGGSASYVGGKFVRRNGLAIAVAAALTVSLTGGLGASLYLSSVASRQRDEAVEQKRLADGRLKQIRAAAKDLVRWSSYEGSTDSGSKDVGILLKRSETVLESDPESPQRLELLAALYKDLLESLCPNRRTPEALQVYHQYAKLEERINRGRPAGSKPEPMPSAQSCDGGTFGFAGAAASPVLRSRQLARATNLLRLSDALRAAGDFEGAEFAFQSASNQTR